ncbi:MAG: 5-formyltetrahydrofolate cyclo-ligase [Deltaproteobacteria bacterium]|nr:5-formyltetrahydrofolate cyclo-ligase [Deltaproteobacteria bacterium]
MDPKQTWRQALLEKRNQLTDAEAAQAARKIAGRFFGLEEVRLAERFGLYAAFQKEVATDKIFAKAHALRQEIYYPAVDSKPKTLIFYRVRDLKELKPGFAGIPEPDRAGNRLRTIDYLNLIVVPGIAFDRQGNRLGRGEGYYDRLLSGYHGLKIGLAYEFQVVETLPASPKDRRVDFVITEERILKWI